MTSARPVSVVRPVTNAPAETCWTYTVKKNAPERPTTVTADSSAKAPVVAASTRGTTSLWMGLIPSTRIASSSSRMVRAPRSAHIAVAPAPETTSTVTIGPIWFTVPIAEPVPAKSAAPNSFSRMLNVKTSSTEYGIVNISAGTTDTRATNQVWSTYSRNANGGLTITTNVSSDIAKKPPIARTGFVTGDADITRSPLAAWSPSEIG